MYCRMACHSWISTASNCWRVTGCTALERTRLPSSAHKCSIGFRSGLSDGHGRTLMHCWHRVSGESCVILLKQPQTMLCHEKNHQRLRDGIPVCHCIKTTVYSVQWRLNFSADAGPHHDSTNTPLVVFKDTALCKPLTPTLADSLVTVGEGHVKLTLIGK